MHIRLLSALAVSGLVALSSATIAQNAPATEADRYSVDRTIVGKLLDDPAAAEVLKKLIPTVYANDMFQSAGRELTLRAIQTYEPDALSDANLAKIQVELDKLPVKK